MDVTDFPGLHRIRLLARWVRLLCAVAALGLMLAHVWIWTHPELLENVARRQWTVGDSALLQFGPGNRLLGAVVSLPSLLVALVGLWQLWRLFGCYARGLVFAAEPVRRLHSVGWAVTALAPLLPLSQTFAVLALSWNNPPGTRLLVFTVSSEHYLALLFGLVLLAMARIMQEAQRVAQENAEFI
ncbi:DUF2975 domain-containing protein [Pelomonas sp. CA6]|uniref:DUF2975 domain-containing protein n=1 Tax=Pelomonas sp. CA6 TaxID=2907999 RepID=UPI001F4BB904|nr:DUF2975 domain-containing protein [Pelomonas sp. CA6]MCH7342050.1 DUF2975 domain-containing protein [Pelomonas sp. CA6]